MKNAIFSAMHELEIVAGSLWEQNKYLAILYLCTAPVDRNIFNLTFKKWTNL